MPSKDKALRRDIRKANDATHPTPSPAQVEAKNYPRGKLRMHGMHIVIETPADGIRAGVNKETGKAWEIRLSEPYGEIRKADGVDSVISEADGDPLDVFIGDHPESELVHVIDQNNTAGEFDECKVVLGCVTEKDAVDLYHRNYSADWAGFRACTPLTIKQFYAWMQHGDTSKPMDEQTKEFLKLASSDEGLVKLAGMMQLLSKGMSALTGAAHSGARTLANVPAGSTFRSAPAANTAKALFKPSFGSWTKPVRYSAGAAATGLTGASAYGVYNDARKELKGVAFGADVVGAMAPTLMKDPDAKQDWTHVSKLVHGIADNPLWAFRPTAHPEYSNLTPKGQQAVGGYIDQVRRHSFNNVLDNISRPAVGTHDALQSISAPAMPAIKKALMALLGRFKLDTRGSMPEATWDLTKSLSHVKESSGMEKYAVVKQMGDEWLLYTKDEKRILGRHKTPEDAYGQEYAIQKSQERRMEKAAGVRPKFPDMPDCVGIDLDGTLAQHDPDAKFSADHIGEPLTERVEQVKEWIDAGIEVRIFTARAAESKNLPALEEWLAQNGLLGLKITNRKTPDMGLIIDDRAVQVPMNGDKKFEVVHGGVKKAAALPPAAPPTTGPQAILHALQNIDTAKLEEAARRDVKGTSMAKRDKAVRLLGILDGLRRNEVQPHELMITKVPVIPAAFRPFTTIGEVLVPGDANLLYQDVFRFRDAHRDAAETFGPDGAGDARLALYDAVKAVYGFGDAVNPKTKARGVQGFLKQITGSNPKYGMWQRKLISKPMDSVSRGVIVPDPDLDMDEVGIPADMAWPMYGSHVMGRMVRNGVTEPLALKAVKERAPDALHALLQEMKERPVLYSRAPAWHKFNSIAGYPKLVDGDAIRISNMVAAGLNADYDGDTLNMHLPALPKSVQEAKDRLLPSKMLFSIKDPDKTVPVPKHEMIWGMYAANNRKTGVVHKFGSRDLAQKAVTSGIVDPADEVEFPD